MSTVNNNLATLLDAAYSKIDRNHDNAVDMQEFNALFDFIRQGRTVDQADSAAASASNLFQRLDQNGDGSISRDEMQSAVDAVNKKLASESLDALLAWLNEQTSTTSLLDTKKSATDVLSSIIAGKTGAV